MPQVIQLFSRPRATCSQLALFAVCASGVFSCALNLTSFNAACTVGLALGRPNDEVQHTVEVLLEWARENHREWFYRFEPPAAPARETLHPARGEERPAPDAEPPPPRHSPIF